MSDASTKISGKIAELDDWRGETLARVRKLIQEADPDVVEEWKWEKPKSGGVPVWSHDGGICTGESYKQVVKLTFFRGASLQDPKKIDATAFKALIREAVAANSAAKKK